METSRNETDAPFKTLHGALRDAASHDPQRIAFECLGQTLRYETLYRLAGQFAARLRVLGIGPGHYVGIRASHSLETVIAVFGVLQSGAAYVPIDPVAPPERLRAILQSLDIQCLVSDRALPTADDTANASQQETPLRHIIHSTDWQPDRSSASCNDGIRHWYWDEMLSNPATLDQHVPLDSPAYVMFTSGSTGVPKGILHTHFSGGAYARFTVDTYAIDADDQIACVSPLHFDMSTFGYYAATLAGCTTILVPPAHVMMPASLAQRLRETQPSIIYSVPHALIQLDSRGGRLHDDDLGKLRLVVYAGEALDSAALNQLRRRWPSTSFSNAYGPAETNVCTVQEIPSWKDQPRDLYGNQAIPIGRSWHQTQCRVVDEHDQPVAAGELGELIVHSPTTMRHYVGGTVDDQQCFWMDAATGNRFYRTGDCVFADADGVLHFRGRRDRRIKRRGFRIELGEIESAAARCDTIRDAAANLVNDQLHLWVQCETRSVGNAELISIERSLRQSLRSTLSLAAAMPDVIHVCDTLPRTSNGKIDHVRLCKEMSVDSANTVPPPRSGVLHRG
ncbi:MAG: AMP-binding protein [Planctomycetota bacterium]